MNTADCRRFSAREGGCDWEGYEALPLLYHVTPKRNLPSIRKNGLLPQIGPRSEACAEPQSKIFLFPSREALEDALVNWLGDEFGDDEPLVILEIKLPVPYSSDISGDGIRDYEVTCRRCISPEYIRVLDENMNNIQ